MAEIVSCAKDTQLHSFPELEQLSSSAHVDSNGSDCQFFGSSKLFVRANKNFGIELLRIKDGDTPVAGSAAARAIANVKKMTIENLYCVACPKTASKDEIAIGLTSGTVRLMNYKKANFTKRFDSERLANTVTFMDFNATDDLLAAVYENGLVNVYGMKTSSKLHTLAFDKNTIKARFHPTKRFHMAVASDRGAVLLYDTQAKKTMFSQPGAHAAPCRDVAMVETFPDYLFSVGYDNVINVFDSRIKDTVYQIQSNYPFESLAIAEDGHHFAVGNLKGYVYGYDLRNLKDPLNMKQIHQSKVISLAFVPKSKDGSSRRSMIELDESKKVTRGVRVSEGGGNLTGVPEKRFERMALNDHKGQQQQHGHDSHDSFMGEIDLFQQRREPPLDCLSRLSTSSRLSTESRNSLQMGGNNLMGYLDDLSDCNIELGDSNNEREQKHVSGSVTDPDPSIDDSFVNVNRLLKRRKADGGRANASAVDRLHRKGVMDNLEHIHEEASDIGETEPEGTEVDGSSNGSSNSNTPANNKPEKVSIGRILAERLQENKTNAPKQDARKFLSVPSTITPTQDGKENKTRASLASFRQEACNASTPELSPIGPSQMDVHKSGQQSAADQQQLSAEIAELRKTMLDQFQQSMLQSVDAEQAMRSHLWMGMFNLWRETQRKLESVEQIVSTGFGLLLPRDEFAHQFLRMKAENEALRNRVKELEGQGKRENK
uniref:Uncharacterized protein n=1 Tax=Anopheles atroparvus TaxID=41427 RepID=A0AAG5DU24_ANOAO